MTDKDMLNQIGINVSSCVSYVWNEAMECKSRHINISKDGATEKDVFIIFA